MKWERDRRTHFNQFNSPKEYNRYLSISDHLVSAILRLLSTLLLSMTPYGSCWLLGLLLSDAIDILLIRSIKDPHHCMYYLASAFGFDMMRQSKAMLPYAIIIPHQHHTSRSRAKSAVRVTTRGGLTYEASKSTKETVLFLHADS